MATIYTHRPDIQASVRGAKDGSFICTECNNYWQQAEAANSSATIEEA